MRVRAIRLINLSYVLVFISRRFTCVVYATRHMHYASPSTMPVICEYTPWTHGAERWRVAGKITTYLENGSVHVFIQKQSNGYVSIMNAHASVERMLWSCSVSIHKLQVGCGED